MIKNLMKIKNILILGASSDIGEGNPKIYKKRLEYLYTLQSKSKKIEIFKI